MIPLVVPARSEASHRFVTRLATEGSISDGDSLLVEQHNQMAIFAGLHGIFSITSDQPLIGDVVCVDPAGSFAERLLRSGSPHNTLLITEQCDQLCVMCSQPPKKRHDDRFQEYREAIRLAPEGSIIGLSGGEPTLHKAALFDLLRFARDSRPDLFFHILSNGQHFTAADRQHIMACSENTIWGIPLYSHLPATHDLIVAKAGAFERLLESLVHCLSAGMRIELRTVIMQSNIADLPMLARLIAEHLGFVNQWSIMQLENIGFARSKFDELYVDHSQCFEPVSEAIDIATLFGFPAALFNMPLCSVPSEYETYVASSISDWKRSYPPPCAACTKHESCSGFFAWHPISKMKVRPL